MKIILSPAKNINEQISQNKETSIPIFEKEANILVKDLKKIMKNQSLNKKMKKTQKQIQEMN